MARPQPTTALPWCAVNPRAPKQAQEALRLETRPSPDAACSARRQPLAAGAGPDQLRGSSEGGSSRYRAGALGHPPQHPGLTTPEQGVVKDVFVRNGQSVKSGQALVVLDPRVQRSEVAELRSQLEAEISRQQSAQARVRERIRGLERQRDLDERLLLPMRSLAAEGGSSQIQVLEKERQLEHPP